MQFSHRTDWPLRHNRLTELLERRRKEGQLVLDLTPSNPTSCAFSYPEKELLTAFSDPAILHYAPDPKGLLSAREAVCAYYRKAAARIDPADVLLTASTSEAYAYAFSLLCDPGDEVLVPTPSYPLFDFLAQLSGVSLSHYRLPYDAGWHIDIGSIERAITDKSRAIALIHPHNPTGAFLTIDEYRRLGRVAARRGLALIVDEVFLDYGFAEDAGRMGTTAGNHDALTLTFSGLSKIAGLPQMKGGWMVLSGPEKLKRAAADRLETIADTYLSVNTPVQIAMSAILSGHSGVASQILERVKGNYQTLRSLCTAESNCNVLDSQGGWYGIIRVPNVRSDEEWALELLEKRGIYLFPGYFFDIEGCHLVVSLLADSAVFRQGIRGVLGEAGDTLTAEHR